LNELQSSEKTVQQITRDGVVEVGKATGRATNISKGKAGTGNAGNIRNAVETGNPAVQNPADETINTIGNITDRIQAERKAARKRTVRKANAEIFKRGQQTPETSRLKFTEAERADPAMSKVIAKSDKAADRYEAARDKAAWATPQAKTPQATQAQANVTNGTIVTNGTNGKNVNNINGKGANGKNGKLIFGQRDKPPNGKLQHALERPGREIALAVHSQIRNSNEDGNTGVQAAHFTEKAAENAGGRINYGYEHIKLQPQRAALRAEEKAIKANVDALYQRSLRLNPELENANPISKMLHKQKIKRDYADAFRQGDIKDTAQKLKEAGKKVKEGADKTVKFAVKHWKGIALFGGAFLVLIILLTGISSCAAMFSGGFNGIIGTSYTAEDEDITGADADYSALEAQLAARIVNFESEYPGYDEYRINADEIGHDPFELTSYLTAKFGMYTREQVQDELRSLFSQQYVITLSPVTEVRYRETETGQEAYNYHILNITVRNRSLGVVALENLTPEQAEMYAVYMETRGNRPDLFADNVYVNRGEYTDYDIPPDALTDTVFAAMIQEAEKYLGYPYVWGGSNPSTSFDCSGFVSWVINQSGAGSVGRSTAQGLFNQCAIIEPGEAKPGDIIFFTGTYASAGPVSHVGIYVGGGYMIHAGNPIGYADITTSYWVNHFYAFGRLP